MLKYFWLKKHDVQDSLHNELERKTGRKIGEKGLEFIIVKAWQYIHGNVLQCFVYFLYV